MKLPLLLVHLRINPDRINTSWATNQLFKDSIYESSGMHSIGGGEEMN